MDGEQLLMKIAKNKETNKEEAKKAFELFCGYYEKEATKIAVAFVDRGNGRMTKRLL